MASFGLQRPRTASMASFGLFGLIPASMAFRLLTTSFILNGLVWPHSASMALSFGLNGLILASMASYSLNGLVWPLRPSSASTALPRPPWPRMASMASFGLFGIVQPQWPRVAFMALIRPPRPHYGLRGPTRTSWPQFGRHGLNPASTVSLQFSRPHLSSIRLERPHFGLCDLTRPSRPQSGLYGLILVSMTSFGLHDLNLAFTASLWSAWPLSGPHNLALISSILLPSHFNSWPL